MPRTGRKTVATAQTRARAISIKKSNPGLPHSTIATRLGVSERQVQYWLAQDRKKQQQSGDDGTDV